MASIQGLRTTVVNINRSGPFDDTQPALPSYEKFSMCIPASLLNEALLLKESPSISSVAGAPTLKLIKSAFLDLDHVDITRLSSLSQTYLRAREPSSNAAIDLIEVLLNSAAFPRRTEAFSSTVLLQRYVDLCLTFPRSIHQALTLTPIINVLRRYADAARVHGVGLNDQDVSDVSRSDGLILIQLILSTATPSTTRHS